MPTALVTGAGRGIGLATARAFLKEGWRVLALDKQFVAWKRSHVNVVIRALGNVKGTGGTAGLVYLQRYSTTRLFPFLYRQDKQPPRHAVAS